MHCGPLHWILEQRKDHEWKSDEIPVTIRA